jgi:hypothetical protein
MTAKRIYIAAFCLAAALAAGPSPARAADVPQTDASLYYFSRPNLPSNIIGVVVGSPLEYSAMRSEDIAWLNEAIAEREALKERSWTGLRQSVSLVPTFGNWPLSDSNRFARWTAALVITNGTAATNIICGYNYVTNFGSGADTAEIVAFRLVEGGGLSNPHGDVDGYIDPNDDLLVSSARVVRPTDGAVTNIWTEQAAATNVLWTNAMSIVRMQMTNGTESVWTNSWQAVVTNVTDVAVTNVRARSYFDYVFASNSVPGYGAMLPGGGWFRGPYRAAAATNFYAWLEGMTRLAGDASCTNVMRLDRYEWSNAADPRVVTNAASAHPIRFAYSSSHSEIKSSSGTTTWLDGAETYPEPPSGLFSFATPWYTNAVFAGGINRVSGAQIFAIATLEHVDSASTYDPDGESQQYSATTNETVVIPLGPGILVERGAHGLVEFELSVSWREIYETALDVAGFAVPQRGWYPNLRFPVPDPGEYSSSSSASFTTTCSLSFVAIVDFVPWTNMIGGSL